MLPGGDPGRAVLGVLPGDHDLEVAVIGGTVTVLTALIGAVGLYFSTRASRRAGQIKAELKPNGGDSAFDHISGRFKSIEDRLGHHERVLERIESKLDDLRTETR